MLASMPQGVCASTVQTRTVQASVILPSQEARKDEVASIHSNRTSRQDDIMLIVIDVVLIAAKRQSTHAGTVD
jgi:hypothetical protein